MGKVHQLYYVYVSLQNLILREQGGELRQNMGNCFPNKTRTLENMGLKGENISHGIMYKSVNGKVFPVKTL